MKQVHDIWFPESDTHFAEMVTPGGFYQWDIFKAAVALVEQTKVFFDIGAHVGLWSMMAKKVGFAEIYAYEPNPMTFECLEKNTGEFAVLFNRGVSHRPEKMGIVNNCETNSGAISLGGQGEAFVAPIDFSEYIKSHVITPRQALVKIDTEGMEAHCVLGMIEVLTAFKPVVCVEQRANEDAIKILELLGMQVVEQIRKDYILTWKDQ